MNCLWTLNRSLCRRCEIHVACTSIVRVRLMQASLQRAMPRSFLITNKRYIATTSTGATTVSSSVSSAVSSVSESSANCSPCQRRTTSDNEQQQVTSPASCTRVTDDVTGQRHHMHEQHTQQDWTSP